MGKGAKRAMIVPQSTRHAARIGLILRRARFARGAEESVRPYAIRSH